MVSSNLFEWLCDDVLLKIINEVNDDAEVWNARSVCSQFKRAIGSRRTYKIQPFMAHSNLLNTMRPDKGMWRAARNELLQDALLGKLKSPIAFLDHATQDIQDIFDDHERNPMKILELTLYDMCVINNDHMLDKMIDIKNPIIQYLLCHVRLPRVQRTSIPFCKLDTPESRNIFNKAIVVSGPKRHTYEEILRTCSILKTREPLARFLNLHDKYFAFQFQHTHCHHFFRDCLQATREYQELYAIAIRKTTV